MGIGGCAAIYIREICDFDLGLSIFKNDFARARRLHTSPNACDNHINKM